jgi:UDP-N-acetylmuramyl pentapeptide phosphotransferase/UDP-N-acetylglucosamine-1-phosphate transferase
LVGDANRLAERRVTVGAGLFHAMATLVLFALSAVLTRVMIRINLVDRPNHRSSHDRPTPKSGGIAIALAYGIGAFVLFTQSETITISTRAFAMHLGLALLLLAAGLADDLRELRPLTKLTIQVIVAGCFALGVAAIDRLPLPLIGTVRLGFFAVPLTMLWIVAVMNLVNFMDGINGLVSGSAMIAAAMLAILAGMVPAPFVHFSALILLAATGGFFVFNFPAGRIFLGDTGSMFLGYMLASLMVIGASAEGGHLSLYVVPILISPLLFDALLTVILRARRGETLWVAHRDHLYQQLVRAGLSHAAVSGLYFGLALIACAAAWFAQAGDHPRGLYALLALLPVYGLFALWVRRLCSRRGARA